MVRNEAKEIAQKGFQTYANESTLSIDRTNQSYIFILFPLNSNVVKTSSFGNRSMTEKEYSASLVSKPFWYLESRQTAELMSQGKTRKEIRDLAVTENIYQCKEEYRAVEIFNTTYRRLSALPPELIECVATSDRGTAKILVLVAVLLDDRLFNEFMSEVFFSKVRLSDYTLSEKDLISFFVYKASQNEKIASWTDRAVRKLQTTYMKFLSEAGITISTKEGWNIILPLIDVDIQMLLKKYDLKKYLDIFTGGYT